MPLNSPLCLSLLELFYHIFEYDSFPWYLSLWDPKILLWSLCNHKSCILDISNVLQHLESIYYLLGNVNSILS